MEYLVNFLFAIESTSLYRTPTSLEDSQTDKNHTHSISHQSNVILQRVASENLHLTFIETKGEKSTYRFPSIAKLS